MLQEEIAARLTEARKASFKRATEAAESLGVPYPTYAGHENGARGFDIASAILYARRYKVSLDWLLTGQGRGPGGTNVEAPVRTDVEILGLLKRIEGLSKNDINLAFGVIENALAARRGEQAPSASDDQPQLATPHHEA